MIAERPVPYTVIPGTFIDYPLRSKADALDAPETPRKWTSRGRGGQ
jgi:hypothetical protein